MTKSKRIENLIPLDRIFLHHENPRHEPYETQAEVIKYLCSEEDVYPLAKDIAEHGISPLDRFAVVRAHDTPGDDTSYFAAEGNRRVCALKLLTDPDLAPPERKTYFEKHAANWEPITSIPCVIFEDDDDLNLWLYRRHHGAASGVGLKPWNAIQQARQNPSKKHRYRSALAILDWAFDKGLISDEDRKRRISTVDRFIKNPIMKETLGLDTSDPNTLMRNRTEEDTNLLVGQFISDMLAPNPAITSRKNKKEIEEYARKLNSLDDQSYERVAPVPLVSKSQTPNKSRRRRPGKAKPPQKLPWSGEVSAALKKLDNYKLQSLYHSITHVNLSENTPLIAVGVWSFFETITAAAGRNTLTNFCNFLSAERLSKYGLGPKQQKKALRDAVERILHFGNATKHHDRSAMFNSEQLYNDMDALEELILKVAEDAISRKS